METNVWETSVEPLITGSIISSNELWDRCATLALFGISIFGLFTCWRKVEQLGGISTKTSSRLGWRRSVKGRPRAQKSLQMLLRSTETESWKNRRGWVCKYNERINIVGKFKIWVDDWGWWKVYFNMIKCYIKKFYIKMYIYIYII